MRSLIEKEQWGATVQNRNTNKSRNTNKNKSTNANRGEKEEEEQLPTSYNGGCRFHRRPHTEHTHMYVAI